MTVSLGVVVACLALSVVSAACAVACWALVRPEQIARFASTARNLEDAWEHLRTVVLPRYEAAFEGLEESARDYFDRGERKRATAAGRTGGRPRADNVDLADANLSREDRKRALRERMNGGAG